MGTKRTNVFTRAVWLALPVGVVGVCLVLLLGGMHQAGAALAAPDQLLPEVSQAAVSNVITIGVMADLSGPVQDYGWRQVNAVHLAKDEINAAGGLDIGGVLYTVTVEVEDSMCNPTQAITAAQALLAAGAVAVVGDTCSVGSLAAQPLYAAAGVAMVSPSSTRPEVTDQGYTTTFRVISRDDFWPRDIAATFHYGNVMQRAAIIEMDGFWGNIASDYFSDTFTTIGGSITGRYVLTSTDDFTATLVLIQAADANVIYFPYDDGAVAGLLARAASNLGMVDTPVFWNTVYYPKDSLDDFDSVAGAAAELNYALFYYRDPADMPGYSYFNAAYVAAGYPNYGDEAQIWGAYAYDAANIILAAIDRGDSTDPAVIRDEIAATVLHEGVVGVYHGFDGKGDVFPQWGEVLRSLNEDWLNTHPYPEDMPAGDPKWVDGFDSPDLDPAWSWINEDPALWSLTANPGFMQIMVHQGVTPTNQLVQPVPAGDYAIQTRLVITPTQNFQVAGLLLYASEGNTLGLLHGYCEFGYPVCAEGDAIYYDRIEGGGFIGENYAQRIPWTGPVYLRIIRQGENYTGYVSRDGEDWRLVGRHVMSPGIDLTWMGLFTANGGDPTPDIPADFDYFWLNLIYQLRMLPVVFK